MPSSPLCPPAETRTSFVLSILACNDLRIGRTVYNRVRRPANGIQHPNTAATVGASIIAPLYSTTIIWREGSTLALQKTFLEIFL
jgi:hypothetical protein